MKVKVRIEDVLYETGKAVLFLVSNKEVWIPRACFKWLSWKYIVVDFRFAESKGLVFKQLYHKPKLIEPVYNQEPIDELRC